MHADPIQVLQAAQRRIAAPPAQPSGVLVAGAGGALGEEVVQQLLGRGGFGTVHVLAREPLTTGLRGIAGFTVAGDMPAAWPAPPAAIAVVLFDAPRQANARERAFHTPSPEGLPDLARWLHAGGVTTLAIVLPHAQGRLPEALKRGLADLNEHAVAALGFERLLILRSAERPRTGSAGAALPALARWMLSITRYMVPHSEQPVRAAKVAELLAVALELAPPGIHVAAPELVWRAAQGGVHEVARRWLAV